LQNPLIRRATQKGYLNQEHFWPVLCLLHKSVHGTLVSVISAFILAENSDNRCNEFQYAAFRQHQLVQLILEGCPIAFRWLYVSTTSDRTPPAH
jgi:hypothetical protein